VSKEIRKEIWKEVKEIADQVKNKHDGEVIIVNDDTPIEVIQEHSPVGESSSNGAVERAIQEVTGQIRALKLHIETQANTKIESTHPLWPWLVEYAAMGIYMYQVGSDGKTARQRTRGRSSMASTVGFGEQVLYKPMKTIKIDKSEARWLRGTWIGIIDHSNEHIIGTEEGVVKCRAIHPREKASKWDIDAMMKIKGTPWKPNPNRRSLRITTRIKIDDEDDSECENEDPDKAPEDIGEDFEVKIGEEEDEEMQREAVRQEKEKERFKSKHGKSLKMYIMKEDVIKYGYTPRCPGCKYLLGERKNIEGHNKECKERIREAMRTDPEDAHRVEKDEKKQEQEKRKMDEKKIEESSQRHRKRSRFEERSKDEEKTNSHDYESGVRTEMEETPGRS